MKNLNLFNSQILFEANSDLEEYRVDSLLEKEPETIAWIDSWDHDKSSVFFDIGANIGIYSLYAAYKHPKLMVFAFEPVQENYFALVKNINLNNMDIYPMNLAISDEIGITDLFLSDLRIGNSGAQIGEAKNEAGEPFLPKKTEKIICISIDALIDSYKMPTPNYVKIDVDGLEPKILEGMSNTLKDESLKSILVESNNEDQFKIFSKNLLSHGFEIDKVIESLPNHSNVRRSEKGSLARNIIFRKN